jgi:hypothetical protein
MWRDSLVRRAIASVLGLSLLIQVTGCSSWHARQDPPAQVVAEKSYKVLRVTRTDGTRVTVYEPKLQQDTLVGQTHPRGSTMTAAEVRVAVSDIQSLEVRRANTGGTVLLVAGIGATLIIVTAIALSNMDIGLGDGWGGGSSSCPLIYSWDGHQWRLDSGTFGGAVMPALQRTDQDNLVYATPSRGTLRLKLANELRETDYIDALSILAVDHPKGVSILPDAAGGPALHSVRQPQVPLAARDDAGRDQLPRVGVSDGFVWESDLRPRDPANPADATDGLTLAFQRPANAASGTLVLDVRNTVWAAYLMRHLVRSWGREVSRWYDPATSDRVAQRLGPILANEGFLTVQVRVNGEWETRVRVWEIGPELSKRVAMPLDLSGLVGDTVELRLQSIPNFWLVDYAGLDLSSPAPFSVRRLPLDRALHDNGTDVRPLLAAEDGAYLIMRQGESAELAVKVPPVPAGMARSYLARATGWYRIEGAEGAEPDVALLDALNAPGGPTIEAIRLANEALALLR